MSERKSVNIETSGPSYLGWRGELLAELALAKVPGLILYKPAMDVSYDFCITTSKGFCFFVVVKTFSSIKRGIEHIESLDELRWHIDTKLVRQAHDSYNPVVLFLFDADTDHGRYLRLDTLPVPGAGIRMQTVRFPKENTINKQSLGQFVVHLQETSKT